MEVTDLGVDMRGWRGPARALSCVLAGLGCWWAWCPPVDPRHTVGILLAALACVGQSRVLLAAPGATGSEGPVWTGFSRAARWLACGLVVEAVVDAGAALGTPGAGWTGVAAGTGMVVSAWYLYQALIHWNRFKTFVSDPGDWLNGVSAVLVVVAGGLVVVGARDLPMSRWPSGITVVWLTGIALLLVLLGSLATVINLGGLVRDRRTWLIGLWLATGVAVLILVPLVSSAEHTLVVVEAVWVALMTVVGSISALPTAGTEPRVVTSQAPTAGALVVLVMGLATVSLAGLMAQDHHGLPIILATLGALGGVARMLNVLHDLTELARSRREAATDELTGMANRRGLQTELSSTELDPSRMAVLMIDLDRFKEINDRYGHAVGDQVLQAVTARLQSRLSADSLLARLGGDEFAVLLYASTCEQAYAVAESLLSVARDDIEVGGRRLRLGASIGVAAAAGDSADELLRRADSAMYVAKRGGGGISCYDQALDRRARQQQEWLERLRTVLGPAATPSERAQVAAHFQPQVDVGSGEVLGVEALVRWHHPTEGVLLPGAFLDLVERDGLMGRLTESILTQAVHAAAGWEREGRPLEVSVNLSPSCLVHPGLLDLVDTVLGSSGLTPGRLTLEITETTLMSDPERSLGVLTALVDRGVVISIDDYGTGYSSLSYLDRLPASELKLDRSFVARLRTDARTRAILAGTIDLGHRLGLRAVAEGVEDTETLAVLAGLGCERSQGWLHSPALPEQELRVWLSDRAGRVSGQVDPPSLLAS